MSNGFAFDVQAVCAGFIFALANANALIVSGQADRVLVIGAETFSRILDWNDRSTCVLFGDGAGALVLKPQEGAGTSDDRGILSTDLHSDGRFREIPLYVDGGVRPTTRPATCGCWAKRSSATRSKSLPRQRMRRFTRPGWKTWRRRLDRAAPGQPPHHQGDRAEAGPSDGGRDRHGPGPRQYLCRVDPAGAVSWRARKARSKPGDLLVTEAIGGGLAWGAVALRW